MTRTDVEAAIRTRKTVKIFLDPGVDQRPQPLARETVERLVESAGLAPFHRPGRAARERALGAAEPWRAHLLDGAACGALARRLQDPGWKAGKLPAMLWAAQALVCVTWLPEEEGADWVPGVFNMEHVAATGAAIQNLCLAATALGIAPYWSSGGALAQRAGLDLIGAGPDEVLLGAVLLFPEAPPEGAVIAPGKMRALRSPPSDWSRWVEADAF